MANIKVKFRKSTVEGKEGSVYYQICHNKRHIQITTHIKIYPKEWDDEKERVIILSSNIRTAQLNNSKIENDRNILNYIIHDLNLQGTEYTVDEIVERYKATSTQVTILEYMRKQVDILMKKKKYGTADNYRCALSSFTNFLGGRDMLLSMFDEGEVLKYSDWLEERNVKKNSISFYMRIWRAVYNRAVRENIVKQTYPFRSVYTGIEHTVKRAVDEDTIMKIVKLDLKGNLSLDLARDLFVFSYCTRGMAFVDIAFLKKSNIKNGVITYLRRKTNQKMNICIEPCIKYILNKYKSIDVKNEYLFPLITSTNEKIAIKQYHTALSYHNRKLKRLAKMAGIEEKLSSYTSRHSWATSARNHNIPISVISAGMGHSSEKTTEIYLASLENSVIDAANKNVLKKINMYTSC